MSARGSRSEVSFAAALQDDLSIFLPGIMPAGEVIERTDGSRLSVHYLGEVPPGEVFKTRRGNTIARAGHGRVVLLGGLHEIDATCFAEEAAAAGPSIAESLPGAIWSDVPRQLEHAKQFLAEARRAQAAAAAESSPEAQRSGGGPALVEHARALRLYEAAHMLSPRPGHLHAARVDKLGPGLGIGVATCTRRRWRCRPCHGPAGLLAPRRPSVGAPLLGHAAGSRPSTRPPGPHRPSTPRPLHAPSTPSMPVRCAGCTWPRCARASGMWRWPRAVTLALTLTLTLTLTLALTLTLTLTCEVESIHRSSGAARRLLLPASG